MAVPESGPVEALDQPRGFRAPGTTAMVTGGLLGAFGAYVFQVIGGRALGAEAFAPIAALWTVAFILATVVLVPLEQYVTREASRGREVLRSDLRPLLGTVALAAVLGAGFVALTRNQLFTGHPVYILQMGLMMAGYGALFTGKGILAGHRRFKEMGWVLGAEAGVRLAVAVAILAVVVSAPALGWAMVAAPLAVFTLPFWKHDRPTEATEGTPAGRFLGAYIGGSAASQVLLAGAPLGVSALGGSAVLFSVVFVTFTLYRAPLTLIYSLQGRILPMLVRMARAGERAGLRKLAVGIVAAGVALSLLGALVGWLVGPQVVELLMGEEFVPSRQVAMLVAGGVVAASAAQITGQILVARGSTGRLALVWTVGLAVAVAGLLIPGAGPDLRAARAFALGEATALAVAASLTLRGR